MPSTQKAEGHLVDEALIRAENEDKMTPYLAYLILSAALGGFLYGYDTGVVGVALPYVGTEFGGKALTYSQQEIATAATTIGSIFGASILGIGTARGRCVGTNGFCIPFGQTVAVAIGAGMQHTKYNWRILFGLGSGTFNSAAVPYALAHDKAREVLKQIYKYASPETIELKLQIAREHVLASTALQRITTLWQRTKNLWTHKPYRRSILTVSMIQVFGQFTGYNTLLYYAGTLFGLLGLSNPSIGGLIPSITNTFFLFLGMSMVDRIGRRGLLMKFGPIMAVGLLWCLIAFNFMCKDTGHVLVDGHIYPQKDVILVITGIDIFVTGFGSTYAHLCWYQSEYLALEIRAASSAISTTASFTANLVVAVLFLSE
ncbi:hypothetical protein D6D05_08872 [Aureobasidium pullulans]|nr:hypothetical protein D6D05_08872 [Aureobasidium pullulans]